MSVGSTMRGRDAQRLAAAAGAAIVLVVAAYSNSLQNSFHFDDSHVIENNLYIRSLGNVPRFFSDGGTFSSLPSNASYRPLVSTTLAFDYAIGGGLNPRQFHLTQIGLLLLLGALLTCFYDRVLREADGLRGSLIPLTAATLFSVHTANTETLNLISARSEILSLIGVVASFLVYQCFPGLRRWGLHLVPMFVGALAKVHAVMYAPLLFIYVWLFASSDGTVRERSRVALASTWPSMVGAAITYGFIRQMDSPDWSAGGGDPVSYAWTQPFIWLHYARLFVLPLGLTADTDWSVLNWYDTRACAGYLFIVLLLVIVWRTWRPAATRPIAFGIAWFAIALAPTSSIVPFSEVANEHRLFFPFAGLSLAAVWAIRLAARDFVERAPDTRRRVVWAIVVAVLVAHGAGTWTRNRVWRSEESLWLDVTRKSPQNGRGLMNYGLTRMARGDLETARLYFEKAAILNPNYPTLEINLGVLYGALAQQPKAEEHFRRALAMSESGDAHYYYARWLARVGRGPEAVDHHRRAIAASPGRIDVRDDLMRLDAALGDEQDLARLAGQTLAIDPQHGDAAAYLRGDVPIAPNAPTVETALSAGLAALTAGQHDVAALYFRQMIRLDARSADGWNNLGWAQYQLGFREAAAASFERALAITPSHERALNNLALVRGR